MTKDLGRARAFYEGVLGMKPTLEIKGDGGGDFVEYELGNGSTFGLGYIPGTPWHESGGVMFAVDDVAAALERVKNAGSTVLFDTLETPACTMAWATDTEGNSFGLHRRKDGTVG
jgi:predicted enzyme related to lactoylglutathione lyase